LREPIGLHKFTGLTQIMRSQKMYKLQ